MASRIYIGGNVYGAGNIGDDAVLQGILRILESAAPKATITVGTHGGERLDYLAPSLKYVKSYDMTQVRGAIRQSSCFISGGGTMIGDELGHSFPLGYNAQLISIAKLHGKRVSMLAIGANNLRHESSAKTARTIFGLCDLVTVRDEPSRTVCIELGSSPENTVATADPAFLLNAKETARTKEIKKHLRARGKVFGVNVVNEAWSHVNAYKMEIAKACAYFSTQHGHTPVFFCNEVRAGEFFDYEANRQAAQLVKCEHELLEPVYYSPEEMIDILSAFDFVIGMRMHALIFAAVARVPFVSVSRVDKVDNFMQLFGLTPSGSVDHCDSGRLISDAEWLLRDREAFQYRMAEQVAMLREKCWQNVALIRGLLDRRRVFWRRVNPSSLGLVLSTNTSSRRVQRLLCGEITSSQVLRRLFHRTADGARGEKL